MSHIVEIQTEVRDPAALRAACARLELPPPVEGRFKLFREEASGWGVSLPEWRYPVVCDTRRGQVRYDNFEGRWGDRTHLDQLLQAYVVERAKCEARKKGYAVSEAKLEDGSIRLTIRVGGVR